MVEWPSSGYVRTFDQSAAIGRKEPNLLKNSLLHLQIFRK
jgi:hypothetical protein